MHFKLIVSIALIASVFVTNAATNANGVVRRKLNRKQMEAKWYARTGGLVVIPNTKHGRIVFVNAQKDADAAWLKEIAKFFASEHNIDIDVETGAFDLMQPTLIGNATLFVVNDAKLPTILHAPENKWALVNLCNLKQGDGEKPQFFEQRVKKEVTRGFCLLAGTQTSNYPDSLLTCVTKPEQLDKFEGTELPVDIHARFIPYLKGYGVTPAVYTTYKKSCEEGWAAAPTNDIQKAVWEKVHESPKNPMKIEFDPKKGR